MSEENQKSVLFLESKLVEPVSNAIIFEIKHPLSLKTIESYGTPTCFKKYIPKNKRVPEGFLIEMGIIQTEDERFDSEEFHKKFIDSVVYESFLEQESMLSAQLKDKILTIFHVVFWERF